MQHKFLQTMTRTLKSDVPQLIVMLTHNDLTVENAEHVFELCKDSRARFWGMKEKPLPRERMKTLFSRMKECGKTTVLEVVAYDRDGAMKGAHLAAECGCDILMGTKFHQEVAEFCHAHGISYMPFVGMIEGRPSVLTGSIEDIVAEARDVVSRGADGVDLLGYRYVGDAVTLNKTLSKAVDAPVCIAGSIDSIDRLDEVKATGAWAFTIGSAFFEGKFQGTMARQIDTVSLHMEGIS